MKYLLIYNPKSGKQKFYKKVPKIKKYFQDKNLVLDCFHSIDIDELRRKAFLAASIYDVIIISGGDGTINVAINGIMESEVKPHVAIIPSGTANDIAAILGMSKNIKKTLDIITESEPIKMDVNKVDGNYFMYTTSAGMFTKISYDVTRKLVKRFGYLAYLFSGAKDMFSRKHKLNMQIEYDEGIIDGEFSLVLGLSSKRVAGLFLKRFYKSKLNDGKFELRLFKNNKFLRATKILAFFATGGLYRTSKDKTISSSFFSIKANSDVTWNIDGEKGSSGSVEISVLKKAISVYVSKRRKRQLF